MTMSGGEEAESRNTDFMGGFSTLPGAILSLELNAQDFLL
jgi:hypothetical protein